jgi:hypothetical protein
MPEHHMLVPVDLVPVDIKPWNIESNTDMIHQVHDPNIYACRYHRDNTSEQAHGYHLALMGPSKATPWYL